MGSATPRRKPDWQLRKELEARRAWDIYLVLLRRTEPQFAAREAFAAVRVFDETARAQLDEKADE